MDFNFGDSLLNTLNDPLTQHCAPSLNRYPDIPASLQSKGEGNILRFCSAFRLQTVDVTAKVGAGDTAVLTPFDR
jgi:hypothetical protein